MLSFTMTQTVFNVAIREWETMYKFIYSHWQSKVKKQQDKPESPQQREMEKKRISTNYDWSTVHYHTTFFLILLFGVNPKQVVSYQPLLVWTLYDGNLTLRKVKTVKWVIYKYEPKSEGITVRM